MQAEEAIPEEEVPYAEAIWLRMRDLVMLGSTAMQGGFEKIKDDSLRDKLINMNTGLNDPYGDLNKLQTGVHKQTANRPLEAWMWNTAIVTSTEWANFYALRDNKDAQPEFRMAAMLMREAHEASEPQELSPGEYHLPLIQEDETGLEVELLSKLSIARCARVSYLTHAGVRDHEKDIELHNRLAGGGHMSPFEHVATPMTPEQKAENEWSGNFRGWIQYRKTLPHESNFTEALKIQEAQKYGES